MGTGLRCRATLDCDAAFMVSRQDSMDALKEAIGRRDAHELSEHGYSHVVRETPGATPFQQPIAGRRRPRKRSEDLSAV